MTPVKIILGLALRVVRRRVGEWMAPSSALPSLRAGVSQPALCRPRFAATGVLMTYHHVIERERERQVSLLIDTYATILLRMDPLAKENAQKYATKFDIFWATGPYSGSVVEILWCRLVDDNSLLKYEENGHLYSTPK